MVGVLVEIIAHVNTGDLKLYAFDCNITTGRILFSSLPIFSPRSTKYTSPRFTVQFL